MTAGILTVSAVGQPSPERDRQFGDLRKDANDLWAELRDLREGSGEVSRQQWYAKQARVARIFANRVGMLADWWGEEERNRRSTP